MTEMKVVLHDGTHQLKVSGSSEHTQATDVIQIEPPWDVPYARWQLHVLGLGRRDGPLGTARRY
jgi:hypothetical protein